MTKITKQEAHRAAAYAETISSPGFREAQNKAFEADPDGFVNQKEAVEGLINQAIPVSMGRRAINGPAYAWEVRRLAALSELDGVSVEPFVDAFRTDSERVASGKSAEELPMGERLVVQTNNHIVSLNRVVTDPMDFFEESLDWIKQRKTQGKRQIGPENYATAFKLFTDKTRDLNISRLNQDELGLYVNDCLTGFVKSSEKDEPNVIEMTNINVAVGALPVGMVDSDLSKSLIKLNLERLRDYDVESMRPLMASLSKLDLSETGQASGELVDLMLRQGYGMERSRDMRTVLRAIANLPKGSGADAAFSSLVNRRNDIEQVFDITDIAEVSATLRRIVDNVIDTTEFRDAAIDIADKGITASLEKLQYLNRSSQLDPSELKTLRGIIQRAVVDRNEM